MKFHRLTALSYLGKSYWLCACECGKETKAHLQNLQAGRTKSCGCYKLEELKSRWIGYESNFDQREYNRAYREANRERLAAKQKAYREANKEKVSEGKRRCYQAKREQYLTRVKANYAADPEQAITREREKATLRQEATPPWADVEAIKMLYREARRLTQETGERYHVDHIVPLRSEQVCGLHWHGNMRVIPAVDNWRKRNKLEVA